MYLQINNITKKFKKILALDNYSISLEKNEWVGILGPSGCGKTTLLRIIAGLEHCNNGFIKLNQKVLLENKQLISPEKRDISFVFQSLALWPHMTATKNVAFMLPKNIKGKNRVNKSHDLLRKVHLNLEHFNKYPDELSGGECQRVAIARALAMQPKLLLMDEPFSHLDSDLKEKMFILMNELKKCENLTVIYVSHSNKELQVLTDRIVFMNNEKLDLITNSK